MNLEEHLRRQIAFSRATYGPGERTAGVCDHVRKELVEIEVKPDNGRRSDEWVDVVILGLDGMWRALSAEGVPYDQIPAVICERLAGKQTRNELRVWPDWRTAQPGKAIEHIRT